MRKHTEYFPTVVRVHIHLWKFAVKPVHTTKNQEQIRLICFSSFVLQVEKTTKKSKKEYNFLKLFLQILWTTFMLVPTFFSFVKQSSLANRKTSKIFALIFSLDKHIEFQIIFTKIYPTV